MFSTDSCSAETFSKLNNREAESTIDYEKIPTNPKIEAVFKKEGGLWLSL